MHKSTLHYLTAITITALIPVIAGFETPAFPTSNFLFLLTSDSFAKVDPGLPHVDWDNVISRHDLGCGCYVGFMAAHDRIPVTAQPRLSGQYGRVQSFDLSG